MYMSEKRRFKLDELAWELRDEDAKLNTTYRLYIDGNPWKVFYRYDVAMKAATTLRNKGKIVEIIPV
jgi:hypothetical protein